MRRKSFLLVLGMVLAILGVGLGTLALLLTHEPAFYCRAWIPPGQQRKTWSNEFFSDFTEVMQLWHSDKRGGFHEPAAAKACFRFTQEQINSFFEENLGQPGDKTLPENIRDPRVEIHPDRIRLAFRYGKKPW